MSPDLSLFAFIICLLPLLLLLISKNPFQRKNQYLPSPPMLPFIGNAHQLGSLPHRSLHSLAQRYGPLMFLQLGRVRTIVVSSADVAREIMKTYDHIFCSRPPVKAARILFKNGIDVGFTNGEHWRKIRKLCVNHLLCSKMVQSFQLVREEEVASLLARVSAAAALGVVNMSDLLSSFLTNIMCRTVIGDLSREGMNKIFWEFTTEDSYLLQKLYVGDYFPFLGWLDELSGLSARTRRHAKRWDDFLDEVIEDHANMAPQNDDDKYVNKNPSFLDVLFYLQKDSGLDIDMTNELIKVLVHDMIFAGTDTTLLALEWGIVELVRNPEAMEKLKDEVRETARGEQRVREEHLTQMPYLKAVIKEILRMHPSAPLLVPRQATQSCQVQGYEVPERAKVIVNAWSIGRDPGVWETPEKFRPERFLDCHIDFSGHDFEFIPFGAGRRICPGIQFAVINIELALANLMHQFDWQLPDGMKREDLDMEEIPGITIRRKERLRLVARKVLY